MRERRYNTIIVISLLLPSNLTHSIDVAARVGELRLVGEQFLFRGTELCLEIVTGRRRRRTTRNVSGA
jgi:hypothetical protein